jgi:phosphopantothenoylcysteine decarboxylase/phosphopantothenate--cysteine ligase
MFAPAMDLDMFKHPSTQANVAKLQEYGYHLIEPAVGELASGLYGAGRMEEPEQIFEIIRDFFETHAPLKGKHVVVTAGPTYEPVDPVRYIGNHSSGKMGFSIADEAAARGAKVTLITGPVSVQSKVPGIQRVDVSTAEEMYKACMEVSQDADVIIMSAAVADFTPSTKHPEKIKKEQGLASIELKSTVDILSELGKKKPEGQLLVGFALETHNEEENALKKLKSKNLDLIVMNSLKDEGAGFGSDLNKVTIYDRKGDIHRFELKDKIAVAADLLDIIHNKSKG